MRSVVSLGRRLAALLVVVALTVGAPVALVEWGRLGVLAQLRWRTLWTTTDGGALLLAGLTVIGWWAWLSVVSCLVSELARQASRGRIRFRVPSTGWFRPAAAVLVVAILGAGIVTAMPQSAQAAEVRPVAQAVMGAPQLVGAPYAVVGAAQADRPVVAAAHLGGAAQLGGAALDAVSQREAARPSVPTVDHLIRPGDDLWSLAQQYLGDGSAWRQIVAANAALALDPVSDLPVGTMLAVPVSAAEASAARVAEVPSAPAAAPQTVPVSAASSGVVLVPAAAPQTVAVSAASSDVVLVPAAVPEIVAVSAASSDVVLVPAAAPQTVPVSAASSGVALASVAVPDAVAVSAASSGVAFVSVAVPDAVAVSAASADVSLDPVVVPEVPPAPDGPDAVPSTVVVRSGDSLWGLADRYLGDGEQWPRLFEANRDVIAQPGLIEPGWQLRLPALPADVAVPDATVPDATVPGATVPDGAAPDDLAPDGPDAVPSTVVVRSGDSLWGLADRYLGDGEQWPRLFEANRDVIAQPGLIEPGWRLRLPRVMAPSAGSGAARGVEPPVAPDAAAPVEPDALPAPSTQPVTQASGADAAPTSEPDPGSLDAPLAAPIGAPVAAPAGAKVGGAAAPVPQADPAPELSDQGWSDRDVERRLIRDELGPIGMALAGLLLGAVYVRRQLALRRRPLGRRLPHVGEEARRFETALARQAYFGMDDDDWEDDAPDGDTTDDADMDAWGTEITDTEITDAEVSDTAGDDWDGDDWDDVLVQPARRGLADPGLDLLTPTAVRLGTEAEPTCDLADLGVLAVVGEEETTHGVVSAVATQLAVADPGTRPDVVLVGDSFDWLGELSDGTVEVFPGASEGLASMHRIVAQRRRVLDDGCDVLALSPRAVYCFDAPVPDVDAAALAAVGVTAVVPARSAQTGAAQLLVDESGRARWQGGDEFTAQALTARARARLGEIVEATSGLRTEPAPWWDGPVDGAGAGMPFFSANRDGRVQSAFGDCDCIDGDGIVGRDLAPTTALPPICDSTEDPAMNPPATAMHPRLLLLGPVDIANARGVEPPRAKRSCAECLGWLMMHPGRSAAQMARDLMVAEGTRRSNMSRLRNWLGEMPDGSLYLPDAYSGRLEVDSSVGTDWDEFLMLLSSGVKSSGDEALEGALLMMRGAPFADAAPNQWHWAEEWRIDMASTIRDVGTVLAQRALDRRDLDVARWAASRALVAAPEDEMLMMVRIRTEFVAGNRAEVQRLTMHVTRHARDLGIDLSDEMIALLQEVAEGSARIKDL